MIGSLGVMLLARAADVLARPTLHGNNLDELVCLVFPMLILGTVFLVAMRKGNADDLEDDPETAEVAGDDISTAEPDSERERKSGWEQRP